MNASSRCARLLWLTVLAWSTALVSVASAQTRPEQLGQVVTEPNGWPIPQRASPDEVACCVTGRGSPASAAELEGVFAWNQDPTVNWITDAKSGPGTFSPLCGFRGKLLLRGGACKLDFGWYNVTGTAPSDAEIYTIIPKTDPDIYGADGSNDFCPLVGMTTQPGQQMRCTAAASKDFSAADIRSSPNYKGGLVGFALRGDATTTCTETHYSQNELHPKSGTMPWIMSLLYESKAFPDSYYLAFEDRAASRFGTNNTDNDGDFNDFVFFITGVTCDGGGLPCDASIQHPELKGVCAAGRTGCAPVGGTMERECKPIVQPSAETCDNIDNDCNGVVDNGNLCPPNQVCDKGTCVAACNTGEFACSGGLVCNTVGYCVDPTCKEVICKDGQVCRGGTCTGGCDGAVCPTNQECQLGRCVDLCAGVTCEQDQVCEKGACISSCACRSCPGGQTCAKSGHCVDNGCETQTCTTGTVCVGGSCKDSCSGAVCPGGAACTQGACGDPLPGQPTGAGGSGNGAGGLVIGPAQGGSIPGGGAGPGGNPSAGAAGSSRATGDTSGCGCRVAPSSTALGFIPLLGGLFLWAARRRNQRAGASR